MNMHTYSDFNFKLIANIYWVRWIQSFGQNGFN